MAVLQGTFLWIWCISMIIIPTMVTPSNISQGTLQYDTVTWKLDLGTNSKPYENFLSSLRGKLKAGEVCKFPLTTKTPAKNKQYILVDITDTEQRTVTLALLASDVYFLGYRDALNGVPRANFVEDNFEQWKKSDVFDNVATSNRKKLPFKSSYDSMEKAAGLKGENGRKNLALGITELNSLIDKIYGQAYKGTRKSNDDIGKNLAKFSLTVVQMVAEAVRFKYIEDAVVKGGIGKKTFKPDDNIIKLQKEWGKLSEAIHVSAGGKPACQSIPKIDFPSNVGTVEGLRSYISLVKFKKGKLSETGANSSTTVAREFAELAFM